jgi:hypothetical protein
MNSASASFQKSPSLISHEKPIVFVVDDDVSVRESLESMIRFAGWQPQTFASAQEFLSRPRTLIPSCLVLDVTLPDLNGSTSRSASPRSELICRSFLSRPTAMCRWRCVR